MLRLAREHLHNRACSQVADGLPECRDRSRLRVRSGSRSSCRSANGVINSATSGGPLSCTQVAWGVRFQGRPAGLERRHCCDGLHCAADLGR